MLSKEYKKTVQLIMEANNWEESFTFGYLDGKRDRIYSIKSYIKGNETTDYAHGYRRGYKEKPNALDRLWID